MDIWEKLYHEAKALYAPHEVSDFVYARHVVAAVELQIGRDFLRAFGMEGTCWRSFIYVPNEQLSSICINNQDRQRSSALLLFETNLLMEKGSGMALWACREFLLELDAENRHLEFMVDYESRKTITLGELMPLWWGEERARQRENKGNE